jgi:IclR family transcriptional regulator, pca regulon regulatory protein
MMRSLARGLRVLQCFTPEAPLLRLKDVADRLGVPMGSAHRTISALEALGYLRQDLPSKRYRLGLKVLDLGQACLAGMVFPDAALPFLEALASQTQRSANMAVLDGGEIVFVARASVNRLINVNLSIGSRLPSHCTSMGKVLLADLDDDVLAEVIAGLDLRGYTPATITDAGTLLRSLQTVRDQGYAVSREELEPHLTTVAAPVRDATGRALAAINVALFTGPGDASETEQNVLPKVLHTAQVVSSALGYRPGRSRR